MRGVGGGPTAPASALNTQVRSCVSAVREMRRRRAFLAAATRLATGRGSYRLLEAMLITALMLPGLDPPPAPVDAQPVSATVRAAVAVQSGTSTGSLPSASAGAMVAAGGPAGAAGSTGEPITVTGGAAAPDSPAASLGTTSSLEVSVGPAAGELSDLSTAGAQPAAYPGAGNPPGAAPVIQMDATRDSAARSRTGAASRGSGADAGASGLASSPAGPDVPGICSQVVFQPLIAGCSSLLGPITGGGLAHTGTPVEAGLLGLLLVLLGAVMYRRSAQPLTRRVGRSRWMPVRSEPIR